MPSPPGSATTSDLSTSRPSAASASAGSGETARTAARSKLPGSTPRLRNTTRSGSSSRSWLQAIEAASVCWRPGAWRAPRTSSPKRSSSPASMSAGERVRSHAAASSSASGMPSRRAHSILSTSSLAASSANDGLHLAAALEEQPQGVLLGQRRHRPHELAGDGERLAARRRHADLRARLEQGRGDRGRAVEHLLAVVETDEQPPVAELPGQRRERSLDRLDQHAGGGRHLVGHRPVLRDAGEVDPPDAVTPAADLLGEGVDRQPRLAAAARADERHRPLVGEQPVQLVQLVAAADERRRLDGQVVAPEVERAQRHRLRVAELEDALWPRQVAQPVDAAVVQPGFRCERGGRRGDEDLAAARDLAQPLRASQRGAGVPPVRPQPRGARVQGDPDLTREVGARPAADRGRRREGVRGCVERRDPPLAGPSGRPRSPVRRGGGVDHAVELGGHGTRPHGPRPGVEVGDQERQHQPLSLPISPTWAMFCHRGCPTLLGVHTDPRS